MVVPVRLFSTSAAAPAAALAARRPASARLAPRDGAAARVKEPSVTGEFVDTAPFAINCLRMHTSMIASPVLRRITFRHESRHHVPGAAASAGLAWPGLGGMAARMRSSGTVALNLYGQ